MTIKPISKKQIREIVDSYHQFFPAWRLIGNQTLARIDGPVMQDLHFESLRSGAYRPMTAIRILVSPNSMMLHQFLDIRHREVVIRDHGRVQAKVLEAMKQQFKPSVAKPLDAHTVLRLCEDEATESEKLNAICGVASLAAYLGKRAVAEAWCANVDDAIRRLGRELAEWETEHVAFLRNLQDALRLGDERAILIKEMERNLKRFDD